MSEHLIPVEVADPDLDEDALRQRIAAGIATRRQLALENGLEFDALAHGQTFLAAADDSPLKDLQLFQDKISVNLIITPRAYSRFGILASPLTRLRREIHGLVAFYCNRLGMRQIVFNERLVHLLSTLCYQVQSVEGLADQVAALQRQIEALERQLDEGTDEH
ncbi:MAG: hypothetical protein H8E35_08165 [Ardenticatenia bacterium]|nr:hypothetical protein [Ardenticatenia bacterium]